MVNTSIDAGLFLLVHGALGIFWANLVSTSTGMAFSFVANGRYTFRAERVTVEQAIGLLLTNVITMWLLQPVLIHLASDLGDRLIGTSPLVMPAAKVVAICCSFLVNFAIYRRFVWREQPSLDQDGRVP